MFQTDRTLDRQLFAFTPRDLVAEKSDVWLYVDLFDQLAVEDFERDYVSQGQAAKDPRLMLRAIFYGLTHGMVSGRKLADACRNDNRYIVLSGDIRPGREARAAYSRRKVICEPAFGNIKNKGIKILVRGEKKVAAWWKMAATAHNIEKIIGHMAAQAA